MSLFLSFPHFSPSLFLVLLPTMRVSPKPQRRFVFLTSASSRKNHKKYTQNLYKRYNNLVLKKYTFLLLSHTIRLLPLSSNKTPRLPLLPERWRFLGAVWGALLEGGGFSNGGVFFLTPKNVDKKLPQTSNGNEK